MLNDYNKKIYFEKSNEHICSTSGLVLIGQLLRSLPSWQTIQKLKLSKTKVGRFSHDVILQSMVLLYAQGKQDFANIEAMRDSETFCLAMQNAHIPSEATLRQRIEEISELNRNTNFLSSIYIDLLKDVRNFGEYHIGEQAYLPLDLDVSVLFDDNYRKENVGMTYHKKPGFAPLFAYLGTYGYMLKNELRPGEQHSSNGATEFIAECLRMVGKIGLSLPKTLTRTDSAHDNTDFMAKILENNGHLLIKRNLRSENNQKYIDEAKLVGEMSSPRDGKRIFRYIKTDRKPVGLEQSQIRMVVEVIERTIDKKGQVLLITDYEVNCWWTTLNHSADEIIEAYHAHGTSEQFHSELKSDMGVMSLPSGKFKVNALMLNLAGLAFNLLRFVGQFSLEDDNKKFFNRTAGKHRLRLRTVMQDVIYCACKVVRHAQKLIIKFGRSCQYVKLFQNFMTEVVRC